MATGLFQQLQWLTTRVKRLCCALTGIKVGGLQERTIDATSLEPLPTDYPITEGGIYQFYGGSGTSINVSFTYPTSAGQTIYFINNSLDGIGFNGDKPYDGSTDNLLPINSLPNEIWQIISVQSTPAMGISSPFVWRGFKVYS
jgi:hypothetical protein